MATGGRHRPTKGLGQIPHTAGIGQGFPQGIMAYEFYGYGNVKAAGNSARALGLAAEHSLSYITGGPADLPDGRPAATCC